MQPKIILASASPRRQALLRQTGVPFEVVPSYLSEQIDKTRSPTETVRTLAERKCATVAAQHPNAFIIAADTIVLLDGEILGKPGSPEKAKEMLRKLSNRSHHVITGLAMEWRAKEILEVLAVTTEVTFGSLTDELIESYVSTGEPLDKAGAYGIQERGAVLVSSIKGSYSNVVGLPLYEVARTLQRYLGSDVFFHNV
jgi:septum formation protein